VNTPAIVDLVGATNTTLGAIDYCLATNRNQLLAGLTASSVAYGSAVTAAKVIRFNGAANTVALRDIAAFSASKQVISIVANTDDSTFICSLGSSTDGGDQIVEFDTSEVVIRSYTCPFPLSPMNLAYYKGFVLAATKQGMGCLFEHSTGTLLQMMPMPLNTTRGSVLSATNSQTILLSMANNGGSSIVNMGSINEVDIVRTPIEQRGVLYTDSNSAYINSGVQGTKAWAYQEATGKLVVMTLSGQRSLVNRNIILDDPGAVSGRVVYVDDSLSPPEVMFATALPAVTKSVPLTAGKNVLKIAERLEGQGDKYDIRRVST
jgi:hypothetical protein